MTASAGPSPCWINRLAKKVGLTDADFTAVAQSTAEQIAALPPPPPANVDESASDAARPSGEHERAPDQELKNAPVPTPTSNLPPRATPSEPPPAAAADTAEAAAEREVTQSDTPEATAEREAAQAETAEAEAERERRYREILGMDEPKPRRRLRR